MKSLLKTSLFVLFLISCQSTTTIEPSCDLVDIGAVGYQCDSLRSTGSHSQAAQLYFNTGEKNQSSELFVYSAWQFGEAANIDSALIAVKRAIAFGMNNPYILDKVGIQQKSKNDNLQKEIDQLLEQIKVKNASVDNFEVITTPINRFWNYFDQAMQDTLNAKKYLSDFICDGSHALKDYYHIRYENVDNMHQTMLVKNADHYSYVKKHTTSEMLQEVSDNSKQMMLKFSELYPKAVFPKTYLIPDLINGSGTLTELGLYIGVDMFVKSDSMPLTNLNNWQKSVITEFGNMKYDLVHELMHFQQSYSDAKNGDLLLGKIIEEGVCDFLVSLLTENNQVSPGVQRNLNYINEPENYKFVMSELKRDIYSSDLSKWMHNGGVIQDRPSNLGYTVGYLICKSYYENSADKKTAIHNLLNTDNFKKIIEESQFKNIL